MKRKTQGQITQMEIQALREEQVKAFKELNFHVGREDQAQPRSIVLLHRN